MNGPNNPTASTAPPTLMVDGNCVPASTGGTSVTIPSTSPVVGSTMGWFSGRFYASSATLQDHHNSAVVFAAHHTPKLKNGLGDYRTIGRVSLHLFTRIRSGGNDSISGADQDEGG